MSDNPSGHGCEEILEGGYARQQCERTQQQQPQPKAPQQEQESQPPLPQHDNDSDSDGEDYDPIEAYCGEASTLGCIAMVLQDIAALVDLIGVGLIEIPLVGGGCFEGGVPGCGAGVLLTWQTWGSTLNVVESVLSWGSTISTVVDESIRERKFSLAGENSYNSIVTSLAGGIVPDPFIDLIIDFYASGYNHGYFNDIVTIFHGGGIFK